MRMISHSMSNRYLLGRLENLKEFASRWFCLLFILTLVLLPAVVFRNDAFALTITVGTDPNGLVFDPNTNKVYVANQGSNTVSVIDVSPGSPTENTEIVTIPVGSGPFGIDINLNTNRIYVANRGGNTVSVIDGSPGSPTENTVIASIPVGGIPFQAGVNPVTNRIYVANAFSNSVSVIDGSTNTVIATVPVGAGPVGGDVNPNTNRVYIGNLFSGTVSVIDGSTNTVIATITTGGGPSGGTFNPNTNRVYIGNLFSNSVSVIDGSPSSPTENTVIATIPVGISPFAVGVGVNPNQERVYVANHGSDTVSVIDVSPGSPTENTVIASIPVGVAPSGTAINLNTNSVYVANAGSGTVSVLEDLGNSPPVANAGHDQIVKEGALVTLDGAASSDLDGDPLSFSWTQTDGPSVNLENANTANPMFTSPQVTGTVVLKFQLLVNDGTFDSVPDGVNIVVNDVTTFSVSLIESNGILIGNATVGDIAAGSKITFEFQAPPEALPFAELKDAVVPVGVNGSDVFFDFVVAPQVPLDLPQPLIDTAFFFSVDFTGVDFSNPSSFPPNRLPKSEFLIDRDFNSDQRFQDDCPVIPIFLLNEDTQQWEQIGDPLDQNTNKVFVINTASNNVSVIDGFTNSVVATVPVGINPRGIAFNSDTNKIYVTNFLSGTVSVIDGFTNTVIDTINVGNSPDAVTVNPNTNKIYVTIVGPNNVLVIDGFTNSVVATVPVDDDPVAVAFNPNTNRVYVANFFGNTVSVIDGSPDSPTENTLIATIPVRVGSGPDTIAIDPDTNRVYVTQFNFNIVSVIDGSTNTVEDIINVGGGPLGVAFNPNTKKVYVANAGSNNISVIHGFTNTVVATIPVDMGPFRISFNENTNMLYVTNSGSNTVSVIDTSPNSASQDSVVDTIPVGNSPEGISVNHNSPNPLRNPSRDTVDQCAYVAQLPHLSKFAGGRPVKATSVGSGGSDGGIFRGRTFAFADPDRTGYDGDAPSFGQVLTESGSLTVLAQILDNVGVKDAKLIVGKNTILMQKYNGAQNWWEGTIPSNLLPSNTVSFKIIARDYNNNIGEYAGSAEVPAGASKITGASFAMRPLTVGYVPDQAYSITASGITARDADITPQITIKNTGTEPLQNIRLVLSPELKGKFLLSDYAIKNIAPNAEYTVSLKLNGKPNVDAMKEPISYNGKIIISIDNRSPYIMELSGNIPNESTTLQSIFMKTVSSKSEQRYKSFEKPDLRISEAQYNVRLGSGEDVIKSASDELIITNASDKPLKNLRIMTSSVSDHFIPDQKNIDVLPAGSFVKVKLVSKLNAESHKDLQGEIIIAPENGIPVTVPVNIARKVIEDKNTMYKISTISGGGVILHTADGIIIRNNSEEAIDNVRVILPQQLARVFSLSADSFKFIEPNSEKIVHIQQRGTLDSNAKQILNDYRGDVIIVSSDGMKKVLPVNIVWKSVSSEHFVINARDNSEELAKATQIINFLERSYVETTKIIGDTNTKTIMYMTSSLEEIKMLSDALAPSTYVYDKDIGFVWSNSEDVNMLALKEFAYRTIMQNYGTYWAKQKITLDKGNWLVDGIANYATASIVGERGMIKEQLDGFIAEPAPFEWYGTSTPSQHGASYTLFKFLAEKYGDSIIDKTLNNLGSTMVNNHRCHTIEQCGVLRAVYDASGFDINDKRYDLSFDTIMQEWEKHVQEKYAISYELVN